MKAFIHHLKSRLPTPKTQEIPVRTIAQICGVALKDIGLNVSGSVFQLCNAKDQAGWLINLGMPDGFTLPAVEVLTLRLFLTKRISQALKLSPDSVRLIVSFNAESKYLPFAESVINEDWLRSRISLFMVRSATPMRSVPADLAANQAQARFVNPLAPPLNSTLMYLPESPGAHNIGQRPASPTHGLDEDSADFEGSINEFQRAHC